MVPGEPGWVPTLAWNQKDSSFTRVWGSRQLFRSISPGGLNCQNIFEVACYDTSLQGLPWASEASFCEVLWECLDCSIESFNFLILTVLSIPDKYCCG